MVQMYSCEDKEYEKELNVWATFYTTFNDDNFIHCDNALHAQIAVGEIEPSINGMKKANLNWVQEIKKRGMTDDEIIANMPEAKEYLTMED